MEIDPAVVNLGAFETFFQEKRPFFIEGAQIFSNFGSLGANNGWGFNRSEPNLVHTRRLGRVPQGDASGDFVDRPTATTILGAAKLTGKSSNGWSFGVLDALTDREHTRTSTFGQQERVETEPLTNYFAARVLKEWGLGRSGLGAIVTGVNRDLGDPGLARQLTGRANLAGMDGYHFFDRGKVWVVNGRFVGSHVSGSPEAIERLQLAPQRFYQRTDTPHISFDPTRTSLSGWSGSAALNKNQGAWTVNTAVWSVSPGLEAGDLGFHFNGDVWGTQAVSQWRQITPDRLSRDRNIAVAKFYVWNHGGARLGDGAFVFGNLTFRNYWQLGGNAARFRRIQDDRLTRGGPPSIELPSGSMNLNLGTDTRKRLVFRVNGGKDRRENGGNSSDGGLSVEWKPSPRLNLSTGPNYTAPGERGAVRHDGGGRRGHGHARHALRVREAAAEDADSRDARERAVLAHGLVAGLHAAARRRGRLHGLQVAGRTQDLRLRALREPALRSRLQLQVAPAERRLSLGVAPGIARSSSRGPSSGRTWPTRANSGSGGMSAACSRARPTTFS